MARETFGKTWWGEQWLQALTNIDFSNRIPRGLSYARNNKVSEIELSDGRILATVKGSRPRPYSVELGMSKFEERDMQRFIKKVLVYPTIVSKLLNGKMDPLLLDIAEDEGIYLFPMESKDMEMECSCPDWAVPCKHIAAAIYKVCSDIDNNPFVLFNFRGADLKALLLKRNIDIYALANKSITAYDDFISDNLSEDNVADTVNNFVDFSRLTNRLDELNGLLDDDPAFYAHGNFKKKYEVQLGKICKRGRRLLSGQEKLANAVEESANDKIGDEEVVVYWDEDKLETVRGLNLSDIWEMENSQIELCHASVSYFLSLMRLAMHCIGKGLMVPKLLEKKDHFTVLWLPSLLDDTVKEIIETLNSNFGILVNGRTEKANGFLSVSLMITSFVRGLSDLNKKSEYIDRFFFSDQKTVFSGISESSIAAAIQQWLQLFYFDLGDIYPVLKITELENERFGVDLMVGQRDKKLLAPQDFNGFIAKTKDNNKLFDFYKELDLLSRFIDDVGEYINSHGKSPMVFDSNAFAKFIFEIIPVMKLLNIKVVLPKALQNLIKPKSSVSISSTEGDASGILGLAGLLKFDWKVSLGNNLVSPAEFKKIVKSADSLIKYKGQYIYIDEQEMLKLEKQLSAPDQFSNIDVLRIALSNELEGAPVELTNKAKDLIKELTSYKTLKAPSALIAELRPYQLRGYSWLVKNARIGVGSIIADDMGLGKTIQVISLLCYLIEHGNLKNDRAIIIVPTSLIPNWEAEINKFAPHINTFTYYGPNRSISEMKGKEVLLTTYGTIRSDISLLKRHKWAISIIDESQNIKNPNAGQTKAIKSLEANHYVAMSGTPVENRLLDYWSVMDFTNRGLLGNKTSFTREFDRPISKDHNEQVLERFRKITSPFLLRRMKTDKSIISDLPDKIVQDRYAALSLEQAALYQKVVDEGLELIKNTDEDQPNGLFKRQGLVLQMILTLKQICNHPAQWLKNNMMEPSLSGKSQLLIDTLDSIIEGGQKVLIFTQFKGMGDIIEYQITQHFSISPLWLHGGVSMKKRKEMVKGFQEEAHKKVMILSIKAGGTGLNLTAANHVIHYDLWWNPAVEAQATDRAFRIGQKRNVFVHRLITKNTFEEKINELIDSKKELADLTVSTGEKWIGELSNKEIDSLFRINR